MPRKRPLTLPSSPWRGKRRPTSQVGAAYDQKAMGKSTLVQNKICDHEIILDGKG
jgi:hypothetical protein